MPTVTSSTGLCDSDTWFRPSSRNTDHSAQDSSSANSKMATRLCSRLKKVLALAIWATLLWLTLYILLGPRTPYLQKRPNRVATPAQLDLKPAAIAEHPIRNLFHKAEADFDKLLARQSSSLDMAVAEYVRRYQRDPPSGFEAWYDYAARHHSIIIDEFDIINEALAPFWSLTGAEVKRRLSIVRGPSISHCKLFDREDQADCEALGGELLELLREAGLMALLPEMDILINEMDEPRVLRGDYDEFESLGDSRELGWTDLSHRDVWHDITDGCRHNDISAAKQPSPAIRESDVAGLNLVIDKADAVNLCRHPEYSNMHGVWRSPTSLSVTRAKVPILSAAVPSTMGDIPFPAAAYLNRAYTYEETEDMPWEGKTPALYWAGKTTGSYQEATGQAWKQDHRQRFVSFANDLERRAHTHLWRPSGIEKWHKRSSSKLNPLLYAVHFTDVVQYADQTTNDDIRDYFEIHDEEPREEAFKYTLTFDLDGNGHSGRFYRLLNSWSLPLKQTVFREWHDERIQPWLHYVPISLSMEDLPEVVRYLADDEEGKQVAVLMAEKGREWSLRALRPVDQAIYLYRLLLELARLQDPGRPES